MRRHRHDAQAASSKASVNPKRQPITFTHPRMLKNNQKQIYFFVKEAADGVAARIARQFG
jgi:hypothetical protein